MNIRNTLRALAPPFLLAFFRKYKKRKVNSQLELEKKSGAVINASDLIKDFKKLGLCKGDTVLVHASMSKIGYLKDGPKTFVDTLVEFIGAEGNVMMPTSPNGGLQLAYARESADFNLQTTPSALGAITEYFRKLPNVKRSASPTEPVAVLGVDAEELTNAHHIDNTPYTTNSPFYKLYEKKGKILYIGVSLDNAGTNLHTLEDAVDFPFPVYHNEMFTFNVIDEARIFKVQTKVHNPTWSKQRKCDELLPMFKERGVYAEGKIGKAQTMVFDGQLMFNTMVDEFKEAGVTMYHPKGK